MKLLMVSSMLLLLNSSPIPTKNDQETAEDSGADTLALEKRGIISAIKGWKTGFKSFHPNGQRTMPSKNSLSLAIKSGNLDLFKVLASKVQPNIYAFDNGLDTLLTDAIMSDKHGFIEHLVKEMKIFPNRDHFQLALKDGKLKTIKYLVEDGGYTPTANDLTDARQYGTNQEIIEYLTNMKKISERLSVSFDEAMKIVRKENLAIDFAYRFYNPFMDKFQNFQKWKKMDGSDPAKDKLEQYMWKNPNLQNFLKWEHSLYPTRKIAIYQERIDLFEYWRLTEEFTPKTGELIRAIQARSPVMVEYFLKKGVQTSNVHLKWAIPQGNLETIQVLLNQKKYSVTKGDLEYARGYGKPEIIEYLEQQLNTKSN